MYKGHNVVTEQGKAAVDRKIAAITTLKPLVLSFVEEQKQVSINQILDHFSDSPKEFVQEAFWLLIEENIIAMEKNLDVTIAPPGTNNLWY